MIQLIFLFPRQNIREQMAVSLERMRELEEQVKAIPMLQVMSLLFHYSSDKIFFMSR